MINCPNSSYQASQSDFSFEVLKRIRSETPTYISVNVTKESAVPEAHIRLLPWRIPNSSGQTKSGLRLQHLDRTVNGRNGPSLTRIQGVAWRMLRRIRRPQRAQSYRRCKKCGRLTRSVFTVIALLFPLPNGVSHRPLRLRPVCAQVFHFNPKKSCAWVSFNKARNCQCRLQAQKPLHRLKKDHLLPRHPVRRARRYPRPNGRC